MNLVTFPGVGLEANMAAAIWSNVYCTKWNVLNDPYEFFQGLDLQANMTSAMWNNVYKWNVFNEPCALSWVLDCEPR
jgi:hypothetical protein